MWCKYYRIETNETVCLICGNNTEEDIPSEVYWCECCNIVAWLGIKTQR